MRLNAIVWCQLMVPVLAFTGVAAQGAEPSRIYHVGNSLTNQSVGSDALKNLAANRGIDVTYGYHIRCGMGLGYIIANPDDVCVTPNTFGLFTPALTNNTWDVVTLQTYGDTYDANKSAIQQFINITRSNATNQGTKFYVFEGWPQDLTTIGSDYSDHWLSTYDPSNPNDFVNSRKTWSRGFSDELMSQLRSDAFNSPVEIKRIRTGEVFYQLDQLAEAGQLGSTTEIEQWYVDPYHMGEFGAYASRLTMLATVYGEDPSGLPAPATMSPEVAALVQQTVWNVVTNDSYSGVPEPSGVALLGVGALALLRRTRRRDVTAA